MQKRTLVKALATAILTVAFMASGFQPASAGTISNQDSKSDKVTETSLFCLSFEDHQSVIDAYWTGGDDGVYEQAEMLKSWALAVPLSAFLTHCGEFTDGVAKMAPAEPITVDLSANCVQVDEEDPAMGCFITVPATLTIAGHKPISGFSTGIVAMPTALMQAKIAN